MNLRLGLFCAVLWAAPGTGVAQDSAPASPEAEAAGEEPTSSGDVENVTRKDIEAEVKRQKKIDKARRKLIRHGRKHESPSPDDAPESGIERYNPEAESGIERYRRADDAAAREHYTEWRSKYRAVERRELANKQLANLALRRPFSVELEAAIAFGPNEDDDSQLIAAPGLGISYTVARHLTLGIGQIAPGTARLSRGRRWAATASPYIEGFVFPTKILQLYGQLGVPLQWRGGGLVRGNIGVAPYASVGLRLWFVENVSVGPVIRTYWVATDGFMFSPQVLPRDSFVLMTGAGIQVHL